MKREVKVNIVENNKIVGEYFKSVDTTAFDTYLAKSREVAFTYAREAFNCEIDGHVFSDLEIKEFVYHNLETVIAGGSVLDALTDKEYKDIDVLHVVNHYDSFYYYADKEESVSVELEDEDYIPGKSLERIYIDFSDMFFHYDNVLSSPRAYSDFCNDMSITCRKIETEDVDLLVLVREENFTAMDLIQVRFDQDAKIGYYKDGEFFISLDMHNAISNKEIGFNTNLRYLPTRKEEIRLEKAVEKYGFKMKETKNVDFINQDYDPFFESSFEKIDFTVMNRRYEK